jgi:protein O-GlcNAc transferase
MAHFNTRPNENPSPQDVNALLALFAEARYMEAATLADAMTRRFPRHPFGWKAWGATLRQLGRNADALAATQKVVALSPMDAEAHNNLGNVLKALGQLTEAVTSYRRALEIDPHFAHAHNNLGNALIALGQLAEAEASYRRTLEFKPDYVEAHNNLGAILRDFGRLAEAVASCRRAVEIKPDYAEAHNNLGVALKDLGRLDEAVASFHRAVEIKPDYAETHSNLGAALNDLGQLDEAVASCRRALAIKPDYAQSHSNLGVALKDLGQLAEAVASCRRALEIKSDFAQARSNLILALLYQVGHDAGVIEVELRQWNRHHAVPLAPYILPYTNDRSPERRLRIGYVSPDLRDHVVGRNLLPLFERHNHRDFEIFSYAQVAQPDAVTRRFQACCDRWCDIVPFTDAQFADQVRRDGIDILVDLALHTAKNRLLAFARKPAPVQASFAGYPGGTGVEAIDYHLTDSFLEPPRPDKAPGPDAPHHLPGSFWCYEGLAVALPVSPLPAVAEGHVTFGCLNNFCKFNDRTVRLWARVVRNVPGSRLLLLAPKGSARERTLNLFEQAGLAPDRIEFADRQPRENYLALYGRIDVGLDTFPYNGHTTSLDSYWMGVPVVTLVGSTPVSRAGWSQLSNLGLTELAAETPDDYVRIASQLAGDLPRLAGLRAGLREQMRHSPLMDGAQFARGVESAYRTMWRQWCARPQAAPSPVIPPRNEIALPVSSQV